MMHVDAMILYNILHNSKTPNFSNLMTSFRFRPPHRTSINCNEKNKSTGQEKSISIEEKRLSSEHPNIEGLEQKRI